MDDFQGAKDPWWPSWWNFRMVLDWIWRRFENEVFVPDTGTVYESPAVKDVGEHQIVPICPDSKYAIVIRPELTMAEIAAWQERWNAFMASDEQFVLIVGDVKFIKLEKCDGETGAKTETDSC